MKSRAPRAVALAVVIGLLAPMATNLSAGVALAADAPVDGEPRASVSTPDPSATAVTEASPTPSPAPEPTPEPTATVEPTPTPTPTPSVVPSPEPSAPSDTDSAPPADASEADAARQVQALAAAEVPVPATRRINAGADSFAASVLASKAMFPAGADTVILAPGAYPVFASVAAPLAGDRGAALLYTHRTGIPSSIMTELHRLAPSSIIVVGGPAYMSDTVIGMARTVTPQVTRLGGANLYETARQVFAQQAGAADTVYLAGGLTNYDAPLAAVMARANGKRVLVVNGHSARLDSATVSLLRSAGTTRIVVVRSVAAAMAPSYEPALRSAGFAVTRLAHVDPPTLSMIIAGHGGDSRDVSMLVNKDRPGHVGIAAAAAAAMGEPLYYPRSECVQDDMAASISAAGKPLFLVGDTASLAATVATNTTCTTVRARLQSELNAAIRATMAKYPGTYSVTVREIGGLGQVTNVSGGTRREPASMIKIFAAWAAYKRIDQGRATASTRLPSGMPLGTCIRIMIHVSDNYCHTDIVHWIGISQINTMIRSIGISNTSYGSVPNGTSVLYAGNRSTSNDLSLLMTKLAGGSILSSRHVDALFGVMGIQIGRSRIASGIPPAVRQVSKPGALWIASGLLQGDTAIVYGTKSTFALSIIGDDNPPKAAFRAITRTVYQHLNGPFGTAASYPREQMTTTKPVGLRSSANGPVVVTVPAGTNVEQLDSIRDWYLVQYGTRKLWVYFTGLRNR